MTNPIQPISQRPFQQLLQQPNEGEGNSGLLPFTQHFSLCQEFFKCHRNIIHMLHRLWTIFAKPSTMYVSSSTQAPHNLSATADGQHPPCHSNALGYREEDFRWLLPTEEEKPILLGMRHAEHNGSSCQNIGKAGSHHAEWVQWETPTGAHFMNLAGCR